MKITKTQLKRIIKEELKKTLSEACGDDPVQHLADQLGIDVRALENAIEQMGLNVVSAQDLTTSPEEEYDARWANRAPEYEEEMPPLEEKKKKDDSFSKAGEEIEKKGTEGVFTAKAKKAGMGVQAYAKKVLAKDSKASTKTKRQAAFAKGAATVARKHKGKKKK